MSTATDPPAERDDAPPPDDAPRVAWRERIGRELVIWTFAVVAVGGAFVAIRNRETDDAFLERQAHPTVVSAADVEKAVRQRAAGLRATCTPAGGGALRSPWRCVARVSNGTSRFRVTVDDRGNYASTGDLRFRGCCIPVPIP